MRGFALWGVLLINMMYFGALIPGQWPDAIDQFAFWAQRFFFEQKSLRLFSFLFGLGFALQMRRFQFGPLEWLWRMLTYSRRQPMRLPRGETPRAGAEAEETLP